MQIENILYFSHNISSCRDFLVVPYKIGFDLFREAFSPLKEKNCTSLVGRVGVFCLALLLFIPVINSVVLIAINTIGSRGGNAFTNSARWLSNIEIQNYFNRLRQRFPNRLRSTYSLVGQNKTGLTVHNCTPEKILEYFVTPCFERLDRATSKELLIPFLMSVSNDHWTLVVINREKRTVEYYDSKADYGDRNLIDRSLEAVRDELSRLESDSDRKYVYERKITKILQPDSNMCGYWVCYFLEGLLKDPNVDFNALDRTRAQTIITNFAKTHFVT